MEEKFIGKYQIKRLMFHKNSYINILDGSDAIAFDSMENLFLSEKLGLDFIINPKSRLIRIDKKGAEHCVFLDLGYDLGEPIIGRSGNIYIVSGAPDRMNDNTLFCLSPDGKILWKYYIRSETCLKPLVGENDSIFLLSYNQEIKIGTLRCLDKKGILRWSVKTDVDMWAREFHLFREKLYLVTKHNILRAFTVAGEIYWKEDLKIDCEDSIRVAFGNEGQIYISSDKTIFSYMEVKKEVWKYETSNHHIISSPISIDNKGNLFFNTANGELISLDSCGRERWKNKIRTQGNNAPFVDRKGNIVQASTILGYPYSHSWIEIFDNEGKKIWEKAVKGTIESLKLLKDNSIYLLSNGFIKNGKEIEWYLYQLNERL